MLTTNSKPFGEESEEQMPQWISKDGEWFVAKEKVGLINKSGKTIKNPSAEYSDYYEKEVKPGEPFIYEGPDRAAMYELYKADKSGEIVTLGQHFTEDPEMQDRARQRNYKSVADYAKHFGWSKEKSDSKFAEQIAEVKTHDLPKRVEMVEASQSGGHDTSGMGRDRDGGFGETPAVM